MKWLLRTCAVLLLAAAVSACDDQYEKNNLKDTVDRNATRVQALYDWAALLTVDNDPATTPGSPQDPAYLLVQTRAICATAQYVEMKHSGSDPNARPQFLKDLCPPGPVDPVYPPPFPPTGTD